MDDTKLEELEKEYKKEKNHKVRAREGLVRRAVTAVRADLVA